GNPVPDPLLPPPGRKPAAGLEPSVELVPAGALEVHSSGTGATTRPGPGEVLVVTDQDLVTGNPPTAALAVPGPAGDLRTRPGDVLVPALGGGLARVVPAEGPLVGAALGSRLHLLRPDPAALDAEFLAGHLRSTAGTRRAASHATTTARLDIRRVELPRLPLPDQQRQGTAFARLAAFATTLAQAASLAQTLTQAATDALATGSLAP
ncbi:hypothetical protein ACFXDE_43720, partial [Kitasatospora sp. NPDC059408]